MPKHIHYYDTRALLRLITLHIQWQYGEDAIQGNIHYMSGIDHKKEVFIRIDWKPLELEDQSQSGS